jgi:Fe-S-cluster containining protein
MTFPCTSCGACCTKIKNFEGGEDFALPDGRCKHLGSDNLCAIYATRPDACKMAKRGEAFFGGAFSVNSYYEYAAKVCNNMQQMQNIDISYRIDISTIE